MCDIDLVILGLHGLVIYKLKKNNLIRHEWIDLTIPAVPFLMGPEHKEVVYISLVGEYV